ncbi:murein hydrolase activator EnvC family protein [Campylobacter hyointestinalis]|uniref:murein hydrolase activator EnvC family protein n=1 Tax=Campylobacter hyointestinalis TaxID=198 RepID=UPI000DCD0477|nr:peptidoglycan DD-metalloendopeptidase family protein [Campylobacter hyointestinalis]RAZ48222.1 peptidase M23 [Campylobacter hyointestinalis subsp. lawsonii]RAZ52299.1 peptidase M23 [Campylobacter hyointestinalis subsp. lawsonii]
MLKFLFCIFFTLSLFGASVADKIQDKQDTLKSAKKLETQLNKKIEELASDIIKGESSVKETAKQIEELSKQVTELESKAQSANSELNELNAQNEGLVKNQKDMEKKLIRIISEDFAYDLIAPNEYEESEESIIANEVLDKLNSVMKDEFKKLAKDYENTLNLIKTKSDKIGIIKSDLREFKLKALKLKGLQNKQKDNLESLKQDKEIYSKKLADIQNQQDELRKTLEQLQILAKKQSQKTESKTESITTQNSKGDIKQFGSSYQTSNVKKYTGEKTIAPLDDFIVKQKFGDYIDPIYNIKIFNESVVLRSKQGDAKVKSVLPGTVVFAKDTAVLDKVVIVENSGGIHTIYAHLNKIAPTIKVGSKVKQGYVIGRVKQDLTFEVTQKSYHIDPLELISLK